MAAGTAVGVEMLCMMWRETAREAERKEIIGRIVVMVSKNNNDEDNNKDRMPKSVTGTMTTEGEMRSERGSYLDRQVQTARRGGGRWTVHEVVLPTLPGAGGG